MTAKVSVHEPKPPQDTDTPLSYTMEGRRSRIPPALIARFWAPGWNSVQSLTRFQEEVDGPLRGGDPGVRVVGRERGGDDSPWIPRYFVESEEDFHTKEGASLILPGYHIYGSEPTSALSNAVAQRSTKAYLGLPSRDAEKLTISEGDTVEIAVGERRLSLPYRSMEGLPAGVCVLPVGLEGVGYIDLPGWGTVAGSSGKRER